MILLIFKTRSRALALAAMLSVAAVPQLSLAVQLHLSPADTSAIEITSITIKKSVFLKLDEVAAKLSITVFRDPEIAFSVLASTDNCVPVYEMDTTEAVRQDTSLFVNAKLLAAALGCRIAPDKKHPKTDMDLSCVDGLPRNRPGFKVGEFASGFRLKDTSDVAVSSANLLKKGPLVVVFFRSGGWDPFSKDLLAKTQFYLDTLHAHGFEVVGIHGYERKLASQWGKDLFVHFPLLSDSTATVMRAFGVFDKGNLPVPALFVIDRHGVIRQKTVYTNLEEKPDVGAVMDSLRTMNEER